MFKDSIKQQPIELPLTTLDGVPSEGVHALWLGQSGFLFSVDGTRVLVDAYLSNYLEHNHGSLPYSHERMMDAPISEDLYNQIDYVIITHGHEDHLDPGLVPELLAVNTKVQFVAPAGCKQRLVDLGVGERDIITTPLSEMVRLTDSIEVEAFAAAHPQAVHDSERVPSVSYALTFGGKKLLFGGDTTVYAEWTRWVQSQHFDLMILPINGRDPVKEANGIVGNMNLHEAIIVALSADTPLLGTHFGMFAFNTVDVAETRETLELLQLFDRVDITEAGVLYSL